MMLRSFVIIVNKVKERIFNKAWENTSYSFKRTAEEVEKAIGKFASFGKKGFFDPLLTQFSEAAIQVKRTVSEIESSISKFAHN